MVELAARVPKDGSPCGVGIKVAGELSQPGMKNDADFSYWSVFNYQL